MTLYHVSFDISQAEHPMVPRIPKSTGPDEDVFTKRICLADSPEHCFQAMPHRRWKDVGASFLLRVAQIDNEDQDLISPEKLKAWGLVPDALENHEYWYTAPLQTTDYICTINDIDTDMATAWSCINFEDCFNIVTKYAPEHIFKYCTTAQELWDVFSDWCSKTKSWRAFDEADEEILELPWAQITLVKRIDFDVSEYKENAPHNMIYK